MNYKLVRRKIDHKAKQEHLFYVAANGQRLTIIINRKGSIELHKENSHV